MPSKGRHILSYVVGILIFGILFFVLEKFTEKMGLSTSFYFEGREAGEYVEEDRFTALGWLLLLIEIIVASRIGMAIYFGNFKDGIGKHTNLFTLVIIICLGSYAIIETVIWELFDRELTRNVPPFLYNVLNLGVMVGIGFLGYNFYQNRKISRQTKQSEVDIFQKIESDNGDHFLKKKDGLFFLGYDNGKDLRMWKFALLKSISEQKLTEIFYANTGSGAGRFDFKNWLEEQGVVLQEHGWY
jgi:hypothetical protein